MAKRKHAFLALFVLKPAKKINWRKAKFQKVIKALAFSGPEKIDNSFHFKILSII